MSEEQRAKQIQNAFWRREFGFDPHARIKELEEALKPFSLLAEIHDPGSSGYLPDEYRVLVNLLMCRRARAALSSSASEDPEKEDTGE